MATEFVNGNVRAVCVSCGTVTTFEHKHGGSSEFGGVVVDKKHDFKGISYGRVIYKLLRCASCGRGGMAVVHMDNSYASDDSVLEEFLPHVLNKLDLPPGVPDGVEKEFREAERCASVGAWRAGSGLLRSTLEKALKANGYHKGSLKDRIDEAAADGAITVARKQRAHDNIRVLGNDVLHDDWREVTEDEYDLAHHYAHRILEDLYDDRPTVESQLKAIGRIK